MKSSGSPAVVIAVVSLAVSVVAVFGGRAVSAQDAGQAKYTVRVPGGLAFSEFKGYEGQSEKLIAADSGGWGWAAFNYDTASDYVHAVHPG